MISVVGWENEEVGLPFLKGKDASSLSERAEFIKIGGQLIGEGDP